MKSMELTGTNKSLETANSPNSSNFDEVSKFSTINKVIFKELKKKILFTKRKLHLTKIRKMAHNLCPFCRG